MAKIGARGLPDPGAHGGVLDSPAGVASLSASAAPRPGTPDRVLSDPVRGSAWITAQLRQAIIDGCYAYGEKLPAERQLAEAFGASRTTVRIALDQLEEEQLVTRRVGSGTFVNFRARSHTDDIAELTSPVELIEVRLGMEPHMTRLAVLNATARDIDRLSEMIDRAEASSGDPEGFTLWDEQFHLLIAECTHNPLMVWLYRQINEVRTHDQWNAMKDKVLTTERITEYNRQHRSLYEAIRTRDVEGAVAIVTNHLHYARRQLLGADQD
ncbi:FadR/GntR family transcriptional regulator [Rhodospirillaceae bacterium SYSU D60014]|uniref:FadR/GntR family transcriptional regulator n=1 Tax=Virgifigura deserti TaxID=2268457 RepID=UPI0013C4E658